MNYRILVFFLLTGCFHPTRRTPPIEDWNAQYYMQLKEEERMQRYKEWREENQRQLTELQNK